LSLGVHDPRIHFLGFIMKTLTRQDILAYIRTNDPSYEIDGNTIHAPKAFMINSVILWCMKMLKTNKIQSNEMDFYLQSLSAFMRDEANLSWDDQDNLVIS